MEHTPDFHLLNTINFNILTDYEIFLLQQRLQTEIGSRGGPRVGLALPTLCTGDPGPSLTTPPRLKGPAYLSIYFNSRIVDETFSAVAGKLATTVLPTHCVRQQPKLKPFASPERMWYIFPTSTDRVDENWIKLEMLCKNKNKNTVVIFMRPGFAGCRLPPISSGVLRQHGIPSITVTTVGKSLQKPLTDEMWSVLKGNE